jgi:hypothetical protein
MPEEHSEIAQQTIARIEERISYYITTKYKLDDPNTKLTDELVDTMNADLQQVMTGVLAEAGIHDPIHVISAVVIDEVGKEHIHQSIEFTNGITNPDATAENKPAEEQYIDGATAEFRRWQASTKTIKEDDIEAHGTPRDVWRQDQEDSQKED